MEMYNNYSDWIKDNKRNCEKNYILYMDVLGYKSLISEKNDFFDHFSYIIKVIFEERLNQYKGNKKDSKKNISYRIFSDNILIAIPQEGNEDCLKALCAIASRVQSMVLFHFGYLMRGAILLGDLYIDSSFVYGKGLVDAHNLGDVSGLPPVIVIDDKTLSGDRYYKESTRQIVSYDKKKIVNYLHFYFRENLERDSGRIDQLKRKKTYIETALKSANKAKCKWEYTRDFFNDRIKKQGIDNIIELI